MTATARRIEIAADEAILRDAVRIYIWRRAVVAEKLTWAVALTMTALLLWRLSQGRADWLVWLIGTVVLALPAMVLLGWFVLLRQKLRQLRAMPSGKAVLLLGMDGMTITSEAGTSTVPWSGITGYWQRPGYWVIFLAPNRFFALPLAGIAPADLAALQAGLDGKTGRGTGLR